VSASTGHSAARVYRGLWRILADWFRVPAQPPSLPHAGGELHLSFHPSPRYLDYLKLWFWIALAVFDVAILAGWIALFVSSPAAGTWLALPALLLAIVPAVVAYVAIHLRYDTMWYVMTERSLRCRRGILVILEHTITFENVQNVIIRRGPVEYAFGIATVVVETAGSSGGGERDFASGNQAILQGLADPERIREMIMERALRSRSAGLGDERPEAPRAGRGWSAEHVAALREIAAEVRALGA